MNRRIGIVEDHVTVRAALAKLIGDVPGNEVVGTWADSESALRDFPTVIPDIILMDINLPGRSGIECVREVKSIRPNTQVVMLTIEEDSRRVFESLSAGASGYLVKNNPPERILEAIREVAAGGAPMSSQVARMVVQRFQGSSTTKNEAIACLTPREEEILRLICRGLRAKEIALEIKISVHTVQTHIRNIYEKLHARSRAEVVAKFLN